MAGAKAKAEAEARAWAMTARDAVVQEAAGSVTSAIRATVAAVGQSFANSTPASHY